MTTAADELRAAASSVRSVAEANKAISENRPLPPEMQGRTRADVTRADMHPAVGRALAEVFDAWAHVASLDLDLLNRVGGPETLTLARQINGGEQR